MTLLKVSPYLIATYPKDLVTPDAITIDRIKDRAHVYGVIAGRATKRETGIFARKTAAKTKAFVEEQKERRQKQKLRADDAKLQPAQPVQSIQPAQTQPQSQVQPQPVNSVPAAQQPKQPPQVQQSVEAVLRPPVELNGNTDKIAPEEKPMTFTFTEPAQPQQSVQNAKPKNAPAGSSTKKERSQERSFFERESAVNDI